ncbi:hypothetical protein BDV26DRAFT_203644 [Aspergillus bertholletiae]|uniref:Uncharacterized protein n=1 Tax=Aspergillus bertholletiae TaxID=1226010 RepID=A0A5N7B7W3_9EURO|nr:hypothetical protein BDV26DRAFT_203644 [Aspergillus bertholletiae]
MSLLRATYLYPLFSVLLIFHFSLSLYTFFFFFRIFCSYFPPAVSDMYVLKILISFYVTCVLMDIQLLSMAGCSHQRKREQTKYFRHPKTDKLYRIQLEMQHGSALVIN